MRLDRFIAKCTTMGRAESTKKVRQGKVTVNEKTITNPQTKVSPDTDTIYFDGNRLEYKEFIFLMLNKPMGFICSTKDDKNRTVLDLLPEEHSARSPFSCGRLDIDTTGLVILTDNGKWSHRITSPKKKCFKTYIVTSHEPLSKEDMVQLEEGVMLDDDDKITLPAKIKELEDCKYELQICEGRFHQVKRMFEAVGNLVVGLHRSSIGQIILDPKLESGKYRELTPEEISYFS
ncbi:MAG: rRNA pseudouridine synthase [Lentisphaeraceae bacterium]|nr:rRNA pseudouridine synthase [Lentisphaeraceae bacterium]